MEFDLFAEEKHDGVAEVSCVMAGEIEHRGEVRERGFGNGNLTLCDAHVFVLAAWRNDQTAKEVTELYEAGLITEHSEGITYSVEMDSGNAKTGMTEKENLGRLIRVSKEQNGGKPVKILALWEGGRTRELLAHHQWRDIRVPDQMEQFRLTPEYRAWTEAQGIPGKYRVMVEEYEREQSRKLRNRVDLFKED